MPAHCGTPTEILHDAEFIVGPFPTCSAPLTLTDSHLYSDLVSGSATSEALKTGVSCPIIRLSESERLWATSHGQCHACLLTVRRGDNDIRESTMDCTACESQHLACETTVAN